MQATDGVRRSGYVVALVLGLIAAFALMTGADWPALALVGAAMALIGIVERIAEAQQRHHGRWYQSSLSLKLRQR